MQLYTANLKESVTVLAQVTNTSNNSWVLNAHRIKLHDLFHHFYFESV